MQKVTISSFQGQQEQAPCSRTVEPPPTRPSGRAERAGPCPLLCLCKSFEAALHQETVTAPLSCPSAVTSSTFPEGFLLILRHWGARMQWEKSGVLGRAGVS